MAERVVVRVPATVANLGPGFDCLGLALDWHNEVVVERADRLSVSATGAGADQIPTDDSNLVARGVARTLGHDRVRIEQRVSIPFGRGLGSSAAACVAGLIAGVALESATFEHRDLLDAAVAFEGHADNVGPALFGGLTVAAGGTVVPLEVATDIRVLVCVAPTAFATRDARAAVPEHIPRDDAVLNLARTALLTAALTGGRHDLLLSATDDRLHQPARLALMPETAALIAELRARGIAAFLSGAGPSVSALVALADAEEAERVAREDAPHGWSVRVCQVDPGGARVIEVG